MTKTILITGASKGIGHATALYLHQLGYAVVGIARHAIAGAFPGKLYTADLALQTETEEIFNQINAVYTIDGIVNNVGIAIPQAWHEIKLDDMSKVIDLNLRPAVQALQIFVPGMRERKFGRIVNIASRALLGSENRSSYSAAKAALLAFTRTWALELAKTGITVNAVSPGPTETELFRATRPVGSISEQQTLQTIPMGRFAQPREIAAPIAFFLSEGASFITGQNLFADGGGSIGRIGV